MLLYNSCFSFLADHPVQTWSYPRTLEIDNKAAWDRLNSSCLASRYLVKPAEPRNDVNSKRRSVEHNCARSPFAISNKWRKFSKSQVAKEIVRSEAAKEVYQMGWSQSSNYHRLKTVFRVSFSPSSELRRRISTRNVRLRIPVQLQNFTIYAKSMITWWVSAQTEISLRLPGWNIYAQFQLGRKTLVYWDAKTRSMRMLAFLFLSGMKKIIAITWLFFLAGLKILALFENTGLELQF